MNRPSIVVAHPILKWAGGKRQLEDFILKKIDKLCPEQIETYHEPFVGGGAIFFALAARKRFKSAILSDTNAELIGLYEAVRDHVDIVIKDLTGIAEDTSEGGYYAIRDWVPTRATERAARMIYLNKLCFNGLYRVNKSGLFNVPYGKRKNPHVIDTENLRATSRALQGVHLQVRHFASDMVSGRKDFTYYDPPYVPLSRDSSFTAYGVDGFGQPDQEALASLFRRLTMAGDFNALLSNSHCPETLRLYKGLVRHRVAARRSINSKADKRGKISELLVESRLRTTRKK